MCLALYKYFKISEKYKWYIRNGEYWIDEDTLIFDIKNKTVKIKFSDINEIFMCKKNSFGLCHVILSMTWNNKKIKLISVPMDSAVKIYETEFMDIFKIVKTHSENLKVVKDISEENTDYWLKK